MFLETTASRIVVSFFPTSSLNALGFLLRIFAVGLEKKAAGGAAWVVARNTGDGTCTLGVIGSAREGRIPEEGKAELAGS